MRRATGAALTRWGSEDADRAVPATLRVTARMLAARTTTRRVTVAPAAKPPSAKHAVRPERIAAGARESTRFAGSRRHERTDDAAVDPVLVVLMLRASGWPLITRVRLALMTARSAGWAVAGVPAGDAAGPVAVVPDALLEAAVGVTAADATEAAEVPLALVAVAVKVYAVPFVSPVTVQEVAGAVMVHVPPPGVAVTT